MRRRQMGWKGWLLAEKVALEALVEVLMLLVEKLHQG